MAPSSRKGFTLIELLVVIAIIAILAVVVVLTLNPAEMLAEARDSNRISDLTTMKQAIELYLADTSDPQMDQSGNYWDYYITLTTSTIAQPEYNETIGGDDEYDSASWSGTWEIPNSSDWNACSNTGFNSCVLYWPTDVFSSSTLWGWGVTIPASTTSQAQAIDGTGWVPIDFAAMDTGSPISSEPLDPVNQPGTSACTGSSPSLSSCGLFYSYEFGNGDGGVLAGGGNVAGTQFQLGAFMESTKYSHGGSADVETNSMVSPYATSTFVDPYEYFTGTATFVPPGAEF